MALDWIKEFESYIDFISVVLAYSPDRWPVENDFAEEDQLDLERSFALLDRKFHLVEGRIKKPELLPDIRALMAASLAAYRVGDEMKGAHLIQDFRHLIIKNAWRGRD